MKPSEIYILIAGEESQAIYLAFRDLGFQAFSCDLKPCSGGHSECHLQMDMFKAIKLRHWDMVMFHPVLQVYGSLRAGLKRQKNLYSRFAIV